ncbi:MAG: acyl-CoA dehydrogenase family protein [Planctomycetota bacterium]|jgi:alkylation response protein AidB-like acyl-CoA dehydrogenase
MSDVSRQEKIVNEIRSFADEEIRPRAGQFDRSEELPRDIINKMAEKKLLLASLPEEYGGLGLDPVYYGFLTEEIAKACCSTAGLLTVQCSLVGETLLKWGSEYLKGKWLPLLASGEIIGAFALSEPDIGSNARDVQTNYEQKSEGFILNGRKKWISFGDIAGIFIVIASNGSDRTAFIVEREMDGLKTSPMKGLLARRASHVAEVELNDVYVPGENIIGRAGGGFPYVVGTALDHGRYSIAWSGVAVAQEALDNMVTYSRNRKQFDKKICEFQLIQGMIADAVTKIHAARALCIKAGQLRQRGDSNAVIETTIAKYFTSKVAMEVTADAVQVHGGNGCSNSFPVERLFREAKILEIIEGTSQIQQQMIAKYGLRRYRRR